jgi:hypothetical protein
MIPPLSNGFAVQGGAAYLAPRSSLPSDHGGPHCPPQTTAPSVPTNQP